MLLATLYATLFIPDQAFSMSKQRHHKHLYISISWKCNFVYDSVQYCDQLFPSQTVESMREDDGGEQAAHYAF